MLRNLAVQYFEGILSSRDAVQSLKQLFAKIPEATEPVRSFLRQSCRNPMELNNFFLGNSDSFIVENGRVAVRDPDFDRGREDALSHLEEQLDTYEDPPTIINFKGHMGQASDAAVDFITIFYPGNEFKKFLESHTETFVVFDDETVSLIENECLDFFEEMLEQFGSMHFKKLRARLARAKAHVVEFIKLHYPGNAFIEFLNKYPDNFEMDERGIVYLADV